MLLFINIVSFISSIFIHFLFFGKKSRMFSFISSNLRIDICNHHGTADRELIDNKTDSWFLCFQPEVPFINMALTLIPTLISDSTHI